MRGSDLPPSPPSAPVLPDGFQQQDAALRLLVEQVPAVLWTTDADLRLTSAIGSTLPGLGLPPDDIVGLSLVEFFGTDDPVAAPIAAHRCALQGKTSHFEHAWTGRPFRACVEPVRDPSGAITGTLGVAVDVGGQGGVEAAPSQSDERHQALLEAAERQAQERDLLDRVRAALAREVDLPGLVRTVVEAIAATFGYTQVSIYLLEDGATLVLQHQVGYDHVLERIPIEQGVSGRVARTAEPALIEDVRAEPTFLGAIEGIVSEVCVPFFDQGRVAGTLNVESTEGVRLGEADLRLMLAISEHVGLAVGRARLYAEVRNAAERLRLALAASGMGTWSWDVRTRTVDWSEEMAALYGLPPGTQGVDAATFFDLVHPDDRERVREADRRTLLDSDDYEVDFRVVRPDGSVRWLAGRGKAVARDSAGRAVQVVGVTMDVSARKQAEAEWLKLAETEAALRARDEILSIAAHELRTPVTAIMGFADLAIRQLETGLAEPPKTERFLRRIAGGSRQLSALIDDLLDVSRIQLGRLPLRLGPLDVLRLARAVAERYREQIGETHVFTFDAPADRCEVVADRDRLEQVLANLLDNAIKYSPGGGEIRITVRPDDDGVSLDVSDTGIGLPAGAAETIFEPFGRASNATASNLPGLGLGLHISRGIIERHGGRMWAESEGEGRGTTVHLWLPRSPAGEEPLSSG